MTAWRDLRRTLWLGVPCVLALTSQHALGGEGEIIVFRPVPPRSATQLGPPAPPNAVRTAPDMSSVLDVASTDLIPPVLNDNGMARVTSSAMPQVLGADGSPAGDVDFGQTTTARPGHLVARPGPDLANMGGRLSRQIGGVGAATGRIGGGITRALGDLVKR